MGKQNIIFSSAHSLLILVFALSPIIPTKLQGAQDDLKPGQNQTVELLLLARQSAMEVEDSEQRDVLMGDVAQDLAKLGKITAARETITLIADENRRDRALERFLDNELQAKQFVDAQLTVDAIRTVQSKAEALCSLAAKQWESGRRDAARSTLAKAERLFAENKKELNNAAFLERLAFAQGELGDAASAGKTKGELKKLSGGYEFNEDFKAEKWDIGWLTSASGKLRESSRIEAKNGDLSAARTSLQRATNEIESVPRVGDRAILLYMIASDQASAGDKEGARNTFLHAVEIAKSLSVTDRDSILRDIVKEQAAAGYIADSLRAVANINDSHLKWQAFHGIAVSETKKEGVESGLKIAEQIQSESEYDVTLVDMAQFLGQQKKLPEANRIVDMIHSPYMKSLGLIWTAEAIGGTSNPH